MLPREDPGYPCCLLVTPVAKLHIVYRNTYHVWVVRPIVEAGFTHGARVNSRGPCRPLLRPAPPRPASARRPACALLLQGPPLRCCQGLELLACFQKCCQSIGLSIDTLTNSGGSRGAHAPEESTGVAGQGASLARAGMVALDSLTFLAPLRETGSQYSRRRPHPSSPARPTTFEALCSTAGRQASLVALDPGGERGVTAEECNALPSL